MSSVNRSVLTRRLGPRRAAVSAGSAISTVIPARASFSVMNRHPVQPSTANVTSSRPANRSKPRPH
jgi:hypothetical protein